MRSGSRLKMRLIEVFRVHVLSSAEVAHGAAESDVCF